MQHILKDLETRMSQAIETLSRELASVRTGRASAALLEGIRVDYYGTPTTIPQMASVTVPDARTLMVQPWDATQLKAIEKALITSDLGLTPSNDGKAIRLTIPALTEERRKQLAKSVGKIAEDARVAIRNIRREANEKLKALAKDKHVSEDDERRGHEQIQKATDRFIAKVDELLKKKEQEILSFKYNEGTMALKSGNVAPGETELLELVRTQPPPQHVAVIMDGNGRWATRRGLPRVAGHSEGVKAARTIVRAADALGIRYLTLYAFSSENWSRPSDEVAMLMSLLERSIHRELPELMARNVRLRVIGRAEGVPHEVKRGIDNVMDETAGNTGMTLFMAFNYGGRDELVDACRALARQVQAGELRPDDIDDDRIARALYTGGAPDPDLLIRTSGEMRISNFLLWQIAYTELWVTPVLWPDFGTHDLYRAIVEYQRRERRFGGV